jgi:hypothetical protein
MKIELITEENQSRGNNNNNAYIYYKTNIMNAYFFNMTNEERENILDQHKHIYDGYVTNYGQAKEQPLYVQDMANDKNGVTINNKGEVTHYKNMNINEMRYDGKTTGLFDENNAQVGAEFLPEPTFEGEYNELDEVLDYIGDGKDDLTHGTIENSEDNDHEIIELDPSVFEEMDIEDFQDEVDEDIIDSLKESVNESLSMFKRFTKYN